LNRTSFANHRISLVLTFFNIPATPTTSSRSRSVQHHDDISLPGTYTAPGMIYFAGPAPLVTFHPATKNDLCDIVIDTYSIDLDRCQGFNTPALVIVALSNMSLSSHLPTLRGLRSATARTAGFVTTSSPFSPLTNGTEMDRLRLRHHYQNSQRRLADHRRNYARACERQRIRRYGA
jgi:hypothetical protein